MTDKQILEYVDLVARRLKILLKSGVDWRPGYAAELKAIDKRLYELRALVDEEHEKRKTP